MQGPAKSVSYHRCSWVRAKDNWSPAKAVGSHDQWNKLDRRTRAGEFGADLQKTPLKRPGRGASRGGPQLAEPSSRLRMLSHVACDVIYATNVIYDGSTSSMRAAILRNALAALGLLRMRSGIVEAQGNHWPGPGGPGTIERWPHTSCMQINVIYEGKVKHGIIPGAPRSGEPRIHNHRSFGSNTGPGVSDSRLPRFARAPGMTCCGLADAPPPMRTMSSMRAVANTSSMEKTASMRKTSSMQSPATRR